MPEKPPKFASLLQQYMEKADVKDARLATLVKQQCGLDLHRSNIRNWRQGDVKIARHWPYVAAIANVFRLNETEASELLQAAGHVPIPELWLGANEAEKKLLSIWAEEIRIKLDVDRVSWSKNYPDPFLAPNLPQHPIVGRDTLIKDLKRGLLTGGSVAISALRGMAGIGKTALAVALAHDPEIRAHFRDGILWANLGQRGDAFVELGKWGRNLDISSDELAKLLTIEERAKVIREKIGTQRMLLVVDDAWDSEAALACRIGGPNCAHLVTTRLMKTAVHFAENRVTTVEELNEEDSLALLEQLAPDVVAAESDAILELIGAVGGLPLSLILIGNYLRIESASNQPRRVTNALKELKQAEIRLKLSQPQIPSESHPSLPPGAYISLKAVIAVTETVLSNMTRSALYALSVFPSKPNSFSEKAALVVTDGPAGVIDELTDCSLLEVYSSDRYAMHQAIADYAAEQLTDPAAYRRLARFFVDYLKKHSLDYELLDPELNNVHAALDAASDQELETSLVEGSELFYHFLDARGLYLQAERHLLKAEKAAQKLEDDTNLAAILNHLGVIAGRRGDYQTEEKYLLKSSELAYKSNDYEKVCDSLKNLGVVAFHQGNYPQAEQYLVEGLEVANQLKDPARISGMFNNLGVVADFQGDYDKAEAFYRDSLKVARDSGNVQATCPPLQNLGVLQMNRGKYSEAEQYLRASVEAARKIKDQRKECHVFSTLGALAINQGKYQQAEDHLRDGLKIAHDLEHSELITLMVTNLGNVELHRGNYHQAELHYREGLQIARNSGHQVNISYLLDSFGGLAVNRGDFDQAEEYLSEALDLARALDHVELMTSLFSKFGDIAYYRKNHKQALEYYNEGLDLARNIKHKIYISNQLTNIGKLELVQSNFGKAEEVLEEAITLARECKHPWAISSTLIIQGQLYLKQQKPQPASTAFQDAKEIAEDIGGRELIALALYGLAQVAAFKKETNDVQEHGQNSLMILRDIGHRKAAEVNLWLDELSKES